MEKTKNLFLTGIIVLIIGLGLFTFYPDSSEENMQIALKATNAHDAARQIASNNQMEVFVNMASMFFIGLGGTITVLAGIQLNKQKKQA